MRLPRFATHRLLRLALRYRRERDQARAERDELRSRIAYFTGEHPAGEDFGGAAE